MPEEQKFQLSKLVKPLADFERSVVGVLKTIPPVMMLYAPLQSAYEPVKKDLKAKGYAVPEQVPTVAELVYYSMLNTELGKPPPVPFATTRGSPLPFGFAGVVPVAESSEEQREEKSSTKGLVEAQVV